MFIEAEALGPLEGVTVSKGSEASYRPAGMTTSVAKEINDIIMTKYLLLLLLLLLLFVDCRYYVNPIINYPGDAHLHQRRRRAAGLRVRRRQHAPLHRGRAAK